MKYNFEEETLNYEKYKKNLGKNIKNHRERRKMSKTELARLSEITYRNLCRIENGEQDLRSFTLYLIAKTLDVYVDKLLLVENWEEEDE